LKVFNKLNNIQSSYVFILLFIFVFLTQFYSIDKEVIDWDESTFIIMGKSYYNGNLPYIELWDGKPPVHHILLGISFKLFGPTLLTARLLGDLLIFLTSFFLFLISKKILNKFESLLCSLLYITLVSFEFSQPTMTEYTSTLFILISLYIFDENLNNRVLITGVLISLAVLTRTNTAFVALVFIIYLIKKQKNIITLAIGGAIPVLFFSILYFINGEFQRFIYAIILTPLDNSRYRQNAFVIIKDAYKSIFFENSFIPLFFILFLVCSIVFYRKNKIFRVKINQNFKSISLFSFVFLSLVISILIGGRFYYHYVIQLFPFLALFTVLIISNISFDFKTKYLVFLAILLMNFIPLSIHSINNVKNYDIIKRNYPIKNLSTLVDEKSTILALDNHIIYLYLENKLLTPIVHPNVITKPIVYATLLNSLVKLKYIEVNQYEKILLNKPDYILCEKLCKEYLNQDYLDTNYQLIKKQSDIKLYKKKNIKS